MKKFSLSILGIFLFLGGVFLTACQQQISLSVSTQEVEIYTNDTTAENYLTKDIEVTLSNSSAGIGVELVKGNNVSLSKPELIGSGKYGFTITGEKSGVAEVKVYANDDPKIAKSIHVKVNTLLTEINHKNNYLTNNRDCRFVVKGQSVNLNQKDLFNFEPETANIKDLEWTFAEKENVQGVEKYKTQLSNAQGEIFAEIKNDVLYVYDKYEEVEIDGQTVVYNECTLKSLNIRAAFAKDTSIYSEISLAVLDDVSIQNLKISDNSGDRSLIEDAALTTNEASFALKRNDGSRSKVTGTIQINSNGNEVDLDIQVYKAINGQYVLLDRKTADGVDGWEEYFAFSSSKTDESEFSTTYQFELDSFDSGSTKRRGEFLIYLKAKYTNYIYDFATGSFGKFNDAKNLNIFLGLEYCAEHIDISNPTTASGLNNSSIDVFSSYTTSYGYKITTYVTPSDFPIDDNRFYITVDGNANGFDDLSKVAKFYKNGREIAFTKNGAIFSSAALTSGDTIEVVASEEIDGAKLGVIFNFMSFSNSQVYTSLAMNLYKVSIGESIEATFENGDAVTTQSISSSLASTRQMTYRLKLMGVSSLNGLTLAYENNSNFNFSNMHLETAGKDEETGRDYIVLDFVVSLSSANIEDSTNFWFEHITGKKSSKYVIGAYIPLTHASVTNADKSSADVYIDSTSQQSFVADENEILTEGINADYSLSKLMLEAGLRLPLNISYQNATLTGNKIEYRTLSFDNLVSILRANTLLAGYNDERIAEIADDLFNFGSFNEDDINLTLNDIVKNFFARFEELKGTTGFSIDNNVLVLNNNNTFKTIVAVVFNGYADKNEGEELKISKIVRYFTLESFFSVKYMLSDVTRKELFTTETLSIDEESRSRVDVTISLRPDENVPTYSNSLSYFVFKSDKKFKVGSNLQTEFNASEGNYVQNDFYSISNIRLDQNGRFLKFRIVANSTKNQTQINDILTIRYQDKSGNIKSTDIHIVIKNVNRVESVKWSNPTQNNEIYLNLTTTVESERHFTISTSVSPSDANNIGLQHAYFAKMGNADNLQIVTAERGQNFNLNINTSVGGYGDLYLLPKDMIKNVNGMSQVLYYEYDENENEIAKYVPLSSFDLFYQYFVDGCVDQTISGKKYTISNYFYNNNREKIYYKDILLKITIRIADGGSDETAIQVYNADDLRQIDYSKHYKIMNNINLADWQTLNVTTFKGRIFADEGQSFVINMGDNCQTFINELSGSLENLTFVGNVVSNNTDLTYAGFVANEIAESGFLKNITIDVNYTSGAYAPSKLSVNGVRYVGGLVGKNAGTIENSYALGMSVENLTDIPSTNVSKGYVGGLVGYNSGKVLNSGFEFYSFGNGVYNKLVAKNENIIFGGLVGTSVTGTSYIKNSYAYAYPCEGGVSAVPYDDADTTSAKLFVYSDSGNSPAASSVGAFIGGVATNMNIENSFAFLGNINLPAVPANSSINVTLKNSYVSYYEKDSATTQTLIKTKLYKDFAYNTTQTTITQEQNITFKNSDIEESLTNPDSRYSKLVVTLDKSIWQVDDAEAVVKVNFGFVYLKDVQQNAKIDISNIKTQNVYDQTLAVDKAFSAADGESAILFVHTPKTNVTNAQEVAQLQAYNTILLADLFGISTRQAKSLVVTTNSDDVLVTANSIRILRKTTAVVSLNIHSKMDMTSSKTISTAILYYLPELQTTIDGISLKNGQTILLQTGDANSKELVYSTNNAISLNGNVYEDVYKEEFSVDFEKTSTNFNVSKSAMKLSLTGVSKAEEGDRLDTWAKISTLSNVFNDALKENRKVGFGVSVYEGATSIIVENAEQLTIRPSEYASFDILLTTDNDQDDLIIDIQNEGLDVEKSIVDGVYEYKVDSKLVLQAAWTKTVEDAANKVYRFNVLINIKAENRILIDKIYENLSVIVRPTSKNGADFVKKLSLKVLTQDIDDVSISTYLIESRRVSSSVLYFTPSSEISNSFSPASDAIIAVSISPEYSLMSHFYLTYEASGSALGLVSFARLYKNNNGYYIDTRNTTYIDRGLRVDITNEDKKGDGIYYFRIYISSEFKANSDLKLKVELYNGSEKLTDKNLRDNWTRSIKIDYLSEANIKVNNASVVVLSKGTTATVTIRTGKDQTLNNIYLQNNKSGISLTNRQEEEFENYRLYTYTLNIGLTATLQDDQETGIFYVCAQVSRVKNNVQEFKNSEVTVCLVDFAIDGNGTKVNASGNTITYNGKTYDAFYAYLGSSETLLFDYSILPESYDYDPNDAEQVLQVNRLLAEREQFELAHSYKDEQTSYYVNYRYDETTGRYNELKLKQQLSYVYADGDEGAIFNEYYGTIIQNNYFSITTESVGGNEQLVLSGERSGIQIMKLTTLVYYNGIEFNYEYYFAVVVEPISSEEVPTPISSGKEFVEFIRDSQKPADYMLTNDIVLDDYEPLSTDMVNSLDGNGYTIFLNSYKISNENDINLALFNKVASNTTLKNIIVNIYNGGHIVVNSSSTNSSITVNVAGFALENNGIIYNSHVVSLYDEKYCTSYVSGDAGLIVKFTKGANGDYVSLSHNTNVQCRVAGFVMTNNASIVNSRVGGTSLKHIVNIAGKDCLKTDTLSTFVLEGQGEVAGFVYENNSDANISACKVDNIQINNLLNSTSSVTAGFVITNDNNIQNSFIQGKESWTEKNGKYTKDQAFNGSSILSTGEVAGFVYENSKLVKNCYANIAINSETSSASLAAGFVYKNNEEGEIELCYSACLLNKYDINQMPFSGVDQNVGSLNNGSISLSYFYNESKNDDTSQNVLTSGALAVSDVTDQNNFYGFNFASSESDYNGIWTYKDDVLTLVSANQEAFTNRYIVTKNNQSFVFYNRRLIDNATLKYVDLSYGGKNNPIIIRNAEDFAKAMGKSGDSEISSYKEYYNNTKVFGNYRIVNNIDMTNVSINPKADDESAIELSSTKKTFTGLMDGNGFTLSNISLGSKEDVENFGLFAKLDGAVVLSMNLTVDSVHNEKANIVGTLAGTAIDSSIVAISLAPSGDKSTGIYQTSVQGSNVVGGVVGMLFGKSRLNDIKVKDIDINSSYYDSSKTVGSNYNYVGTNLRNLAMKDSSLTALVQKISYAGAVAGYVDIYNESRLDKTAKFAGSLQVSDCDIVTIKVSDAVDIYGEVAGGIFGYVGNSTLIYDAKIELAADQNKTNPSYIISKNLYAGGLIGESYGGMFAVYASYSQDLQKQIEDNQYAYYQSGNVTERGQDTIFSYLDSTDADYGRKNNAPKYIGGLVGFMGGGYINVGYNKLNVVAHADMTSANVNGKNDVNAVGGIVGFISLDKNTNAEYDIPAIKNTQKVNVMLQEVYSTGDTYAAVKNTSSNNGWAGGLVGALNKDSKLALKNALALNYYSIEGNLLAGSKHASLIGTLQNASGKIESGSDYSIYVLGSDNTYTSVKTGNGNNTNVGSNTVGGYDTIYYSANPIVTTSNNTTMLMFGDGFDVDTRTYGYLLNATHIGNVSQNNIHTQFYNYFLPIGWSEEYWVHPEANFYPEIYLLPKVEVLYWDQDNYKVIKEGIESNPSITIVVRGLDSKTSTYKDIQVSEPLSADFKGRLVSYEYYMNSKEEGVIARRDDLVKDNNTIIGGKIGDSVGLILKDSLLSSNSGATIEGLNIYMTKANGKAKIDYALTSAGVEDVIFRDVKLVLNDKVEILKKSSADKYQINGQDYIAGGLLANVATSTSFVNIDIVLRSVASNENDITFGLTNNDDTSSNVAFGLAAGVAEQKSNFSSMTISGIKLSRENSNAPIKIGYGNDQTTIANTLSTGLYVGEAIKSQNAKMTIGVSPLSGIEQKISFNSIKTANVGGYVGKAEAISSIEIQQSMSLEGVSQDTETQMNLTLDSTINKLVLAAIIGQTENCDDLEIGVGGAKNNITVNLQQLASETKTITNAVIGGVVGQANNGMNIANADITFNLSKVNPKKALSAPEFEANYYEYGIENQFTVTGTATVGGIVGLLQAGNGLIITNSSVQGEVVLQNNNEMSVGGLVGEAQAGLTVGLGNSNKLKLALTNNKDTASTNIGGVIGKLNISTNGTKVEIGASTSGDSMAVSINDITLVDAKNVNYGGAIGNDLFVLKTNDNPEIGNDEESIQYVSHGGDLKLYGKSLKESTIKAGGIVGHKDLPVNDSEGDLEMIVDNCYAYGNVFALNKAKLRQNEQGKFETENKMTSYAFGGIFATAGKAKITNSCSLMTNFNSRVTSSTQNYNASALVGENVDLVTFENCGYSSGVNLAYQKPKASDGVAQMMIGVLDMGYGVEEFEGYSSSAAYNAQTFAVNNDSNNNYNILEKFREIKDANAKEGSKLNPKIVNKENLTVSSGKAIGVDEADETEICWTALTQNIELNETESGKASKVLADNLSNAVLVGNGMVISKTAAQGAELEASTGGLFNTMGNAGEKEDAAPKSVMFSVVSSVVTNFDISEEAKQNKVVSYGAVAGTVYGNSIVYGIKVGGSVSIGGQGEANFGGIVGYSYGGLISDSYVDAELSYRAGDGGIFSGISTYNAETPSVLKNAFTAGFMTTYVNTNGSKIAKSEKNDNFEKTNAVINCYTYVETKFDNVLSKTFTDGNKPEFENELNNFDSSNNIDLSRQMSYYKATKDGEGKVSNNLEAFDEVKVASEFENYYWYFNPYVNNGYASLGFGYMKNVTVYTRSVKTSSNGTLLTTLEVKKENGDLDEENSLFEYKYTPISFKQTDLIGEGFTLTQEGGLINKLYYSIPNVEKYIDMIDTLKAKVTSSDATGGDVYGTGDNYNKDYRFMIKYDLNLSSLSDELSQNISRYNDTFSGSAATLEIDGNNKTISGADKSLFGTFDGTIRNLRISDMDLSNQALLADEFNGNLENITAIGNVTISSKTLAGGLVNTLNGNAIAVDSTINVRSSFGGVIGGITGKWTGTKISYSTNAGQVISTAKNSTVGGLVGISKVKGVVEYSYNANSVLAGYTGKEVGNYYAGGLIGRVEAKKNEYSGQEYQIEKGSVDFKNSYNVGLVGAGNYKNTGEAYAGGLLGAVLFTYNNGTNIVKGSSVADVTVSNCVNDGAVEALSQTSDVAGAAKVYYKLKSGSEQVDYSNKPDSLTYQMILDYGSAARRVYAYGLGFGISGEVKDSYSTQNNIKNDGWIANAENGTTETAENIFKVAEDSSVSAESNENKNIYYDKVSSNVKVGDYIQVVDLTFDRQDILDNSKGETDYIKGKFDSKAAADTTDGKKAIYSNGYDSYGFVNRVYMNDNIIRKIENDNFIKNKEYSTDDSDGFFTSRGIFDWMHGKAAFNVAAQLIKNSEGTLDSSSIADVTRIYSGNKKVVSSLNITVPDNISKEDYIYNFASATDYYAYATFENYRTILNGNKYLTNDVNIVGAGDQNNVSSLIETIDAAKENNDTTFETLKVQDKIIGFANNSLNITNVLSPFNKTYRNVQIKISDPNAVLDNISKRSIKFQTESKYATYNIEKMNLDRNNKTVVFDVMFYFETKEDADKFDANAYLEYEGQKEIELNASDFFEGTDKSGQKVNGFILDGFEDPSLSDDDLNSVTITELKINNDATITNEAKLTKVTSEGTSKAVNGLIDGKDYYLLHISGASKSSDSVVKVGNVSIADGATISFKYKYKTESNSVGSYSIDKDSIIYQSDSVDIVASDVQTKFTLSNYSKQTQTLTANTQITHGTDTNADLITIIGDNSKYAAWDGSKWILTNASDIFEVSADGQTLTIKTTSNYYLYTIRNGGKYNFEDENAKTITINGLTNGNVSLVLDTVSGSGNITFTPTGAAGQYTVGGIGDGLTKDQIQVGGSITNTNFTAETIGGNVFESCEITVSPKLSGFKIKGQNLVTVSGDSFNQQYISISESDDFADIPAFYLPSGFTGKISWEKYVINNLPQGDDGNCVTISSYNDDDGNACKDVSVKGIKIMSEKGSVATLSVIKNYTNNLLNSVVNSYDSISYSVKISDVNGVKQSVISISKNDPEEQNSQEDGSQEGTINYHTYEYTLNQYTGKMTAEYVGHEISYSEEGVNNTITSRVNIDNYNWAFDSDIYMFISGFTDDGKQITLAKTCEDKITINGKSVKFKGIEVPVYGAKVNVENTYNITNVKVSSNSEYDFKDLTDSFGDGKVKSIYYKKPVETNWNEHNEGEKLELTGRDKIKYEILYSVEGKEFGIKTFIVNSDDNDNNKVKADVAYITDDINMRYYDIGEKAIIGNSYFIRYVTDDDKPLFNKLSANINNVNFIIIRRGIDFKDGQSYGLVFNEVASSEISNINVFGGIRNINSSDLKKVSVSTFANKILNKLKNLNNYSFLKANDGRACGTLLNIYNELPTGATLENVVSSEVLIAGDGYDGSAGYVVSNACGKESDNDGTDGGEVTTHSEGNKLKDNMFKRIGLAGMGGYGGNGLNGKAGEGGYNGAKKGTSGNGQKNSNDKPIETVGSRGRVVYNKSANNENSNVYDDPYGYRIFDGNGGLGGFGTVNFSLADKTYVKTAGFGGETGATATFDNNGKSQNGTYIFNKNYGNHGGSVGTGIGTDNVYYDYDWWDGTWYNRGVAEELKNAVKSNAGGKIANRSLYYFGNYELKYNNFNVEIDNYKFTWCSGECINSPGQGTTSGIQVN